MWEKKACLWRLVAIVYTEDGVLINTELLEHKKKVRIKKLGFIFMQKASSGLRRKCNIYCRSKDIPGRESFRLHSVAAGGLQCVCKACLGPELPERCEDEMSHHMLKNQIQPTMAHKRTPTWGLRPHSMNTFRSKEAYYRIR